MIKTTIYQYISLYETTEDGVILILIEKQCLSDGVEATKRERQLIEELKPSLNSVIPFRTKEEKKEIKQQ